MLCNYLNYLLYFSVYSWDYLFHVLVDIFDHERRDPDVHTDCNKASSQTWNLERQAPRANHTRFKNANVNQK